MSILEKIPSWDNSNIFNGFDDPKIEEIFDQCAIITNKLKEFSFDHSNTTYALLKEYSDFLPIIYEILTFCNCALSVNSQNTQAKQTQAIFHNYFTKLRNAFEPLSESIQNLSDNDFEQFFKQESISYLKDFFAYKRKQLVFSLG